MRSRVNRSPPAGSRPRAKRRRGALRRADQGLREQPDRGLPTRSPRPSLRASRRPARGRRAAPARRSAPPAAPDGPERRRLGVPATAARRRSGVPSSVSTRRRGSRARRPGSALQLAGLPPDACRRGAGRSAPSAATTTGIESTPAGRAGKRLPQPGEKPAAVGVELPRGHRIAAPQQSRHVLEAAIPRQLNRVAPSVEEPARRGRAPSIPFR